MTDDDDVEVSPQAAGLLLTYILCGSNCLVKNIFKWLPTSWK